MTDRLKGVTVLFDQDIREDDAEHIINAIKCIKHVAAVEPSVSTSQDWFAEERARQELLDEILELLRKPKPS